MLCIVGQEPISVQETVSTPVLCLGYTVLYTLFACDFSKGKMVYDVYVQDFDNALSHALVAIRHYHRHSSQQLNRQQMFSLGLGIMSSLYFVAIKCRHCSVRDMALYALSTEPLQEGPWNRDSAFLMTRMLVEMEEKFRIPGTVGPEGIPVEARIIGVNFLLKAEMGELVFVVDRPGERVKRFVKYGSELGN